MERKDELLNAAIGYLLEHGLAGLSLRPLAAAIGTSARLLIYHFESREGLLAQVLNAMHARLQDSYSRLLASPTRRSDEPPLRSFWLWATSGQNFAYLKLVYELQILAARDPERYGQLLSRASFDWLERAKAALPVSERTPAMATLLVAVFDGLFLELMSTGDRRRTTRALDAFIRTVTVARARA